MDLLAPTAPNARAARTSSSHSVWKSVRTHGYRLHVYGYTDDIGTDEYNQGLSERRAQAVRAYFAKSGIPREIMTTKGFGKSSPSVKAKSPEAREKNRRVEIGIVDTVIKYAE